MSGRVDDARHAASVVKASLVGREVTRVLLDYQVTLEWTVGGPTTQLKLETPFDLVDDSGASWRVDPERLGLGATPVAALFGASIEDVRVAEDGSIEVDLADGRKIRTQAHGDYEAWEYVSHDGGLVVCLPGGGLAIWDPRPDARADDQPEGLAERLAKVPDEDAPPHVRAIARLAIAVFPWAVIAAAALLLALAPIASSPASGPGGTGSGQWDPAIRGEGFADVGPFGFPWLPFLLVVSVFGCASAIRRVWWRRSLPTQRVSTNLSSVKLTKRNRSASLGLAIVLSLYLVWTLGLDEWQPLRAGSISGPGIGLSEVLHDGDVSDYASRVRTGSDRFVYRVAPGEPFTFLLSIRNDGPVRVTLLGESAEPNPNPAEPDETRGYELTGLALLRDPLVVSTDPVDLRSFTAIALEPGDEVTVVFAHVGDSCADPAGQAVDDPGGSIGALGVRLVYEMVAWRREATVWLPFDYTVATSALCPRLD